MILKIYQIDAFTDKVFTGKPAQLSDRKGYLQCVDLNDSVEISGHGKLYLTGEIYLQ